METSVYDKEFCAAIKALADKHESEGHIVLPAIIKAHNGDIEKTMLLMPNCPVKREIFKSCGRDYPGDMIW